jgi:hypothetical protein
MRDESRTFDFGDSSVSDSSFDDVESTADEFLVARGGADGSRFSKIRHVRESGGWTMVGALAGIASVIAAIVFGLVQAL